MNGYRATTLAVEDKLNVVSRRAGRRRARASRTGTAIAIIIGTAAFLRGALTARGAAGLHPDIKNKL